MSRTWSMMRRTVGVGPNLNQKSVSTSAMESSATSLTGRSELAAMRLSTSQASRPLPLGLKLYCFRIRPFFRRLSPNAGPVPAKELHLFGRRSLIRVAYSAPEPKEPSGFGV